MQEANIPYLSLVIPVYNRPEILIDTIESIRRQDSNEWECILVDDFSDEKVSLIIKAEAEKDSRFRYCLNQHKKGAPGARNTGVENARGPYIYFFDSDNLLHDHALEKICLKLKALNPDVLVFFGRVLNENKIRIGQFHWRCEGEIQDQLLKGKTYVDNNLSVINKERLMSIGLSDEDCPSYQEWDTHIRLSEICTYATLEEELIDYIRWDAHTISSDPLKSAEGLLYVLEKHSTLFKKYPKNFLSYGIQVQELISDCNEIASKKEIHKRIIKLIPNFFLRSFFLRNQLRFGSLLTSLRNKLSIKRN
jgi:glycosyltransferase involved in cell wall biosynthesis